MEFPVKTCKNPIYVAEGGLTAGVTVHTMLTQMTMVGTIGPGAIPPRPHFAGFYSSRLKTRKAPPPNFRDFVEVFVTISG